MNIIKQMLNDFKSKIKEEKNNLIILVSILLIFGFGFIFGSLAGYHKGMEYSNSIYQKDYEYQSKRIDTIRMKQERLKYTYDSIRINIMKYKNQ